MNRKKILVFIALILFGAILVVWVSQWVRTGTPIPTEIIEVRRKTEAAKIHDADLHRRILDAYQADVLIYGRVDDQEGRPVQDAKVVAQLIKGPFDRSVEGNIELRSDVDGRFEVRGVKALSVGLSAHKTGYRPIDGESDMRSPSSFKMVRGLDDSEFSGGFSNPDKPLILTLYKPGPTEELIKNNSKINLAIDGTASFINLGRDSNGRDHGILVACKSDLTSAADSANKFDWKLEIEVSNGGFVERLDKLNFVAPEAGYDSELIFEFGKNDPKVKWDRAISKSYFVRFSDGTHAIWNFEMIAGFKNVFKSKSYFNPKANSRNLEIPVGERQ